MFSPPTRPSRTAVPARPWAWAGLVLLAAAAPAFPQAAPFAGSSGPFFDYYLPDDPNEPTQPGFIPAPFLDNSATSAATVSTLLSARFNSGQVLAVKVREPLTNPSALAVFNNFPVQFVFDSFSDAARTGRTRSVADQVLASTKSQNAYVGNFNFYPNASVDPSRPASLAGSQAPLFQLKPVSTDYTSSKGSIGTPSGVTLTGNQIATPALFPGSPDFRNPAQGNSGAPNIRSALFTLPIERLTYTTLGVHGFSGVPGGSMAYAVSGPSHTAERIIPAVARFNNFGNAALGGGPDGSGFVQNAANPANGQLLSRGDFQAQVLHYRMRGADSATLFPGSVAGYTVSQEQSDVKAGWAASSVANGIFVRGAYAYANLSNVIGDSGSESGDVNPRSTELAGAVWSGVYDRAGSTDPATGRRRLTILLSNLSAVQKIVDLPNSIGGFSTFEAPNGTSLDRFDDHVIDPGQHRLLNFALQTSSRGRLEWVFTGDQFIGLDTNRNGVGTGTRIVPVPEPATVLGACALAAAGWVGFRRRRWAGAAAAL